MELDLCLENAVVLVRAIQRGSGVAEPSNLLDRLKTLAFLQTRCPPASKVVSLSDQYRDYISFVWNPSDDELVEVVRQVLEQQGPVRVRLPVSVSNSENLDEVLKGLSGTDRPL